MRVKYSCQSGELSSCRLLGNVDRKRLRFAYVPQTGCFEKVLSAPAMRVSVLPSGATSHSNGDRFVSLLKHTRDATVHCLAVRNFNVTPPARVPGLPYREHDG